MMSVAFNACAFLCVAFDVRLRIFCDCQVLPMKFILLRNKKLNIMLKIIVNNLHLMIQVLLRNMAPCAIAAGVTAPPGGSGDHDRGPCDERETRHTWELSAINISARKVSNYPSDTSISVF